MAILYPSAPETDLTSVNANIATNTSNIATNTTSIATNTSNIATNTTNIASAGKIITLADETSTSNEYSRTINFDQVDLVNEYAEIRCLVRGEMQSQRNVLCFQVAGISMVSYTLFDQFQTSTYTTFRVGRNHVCTQGQNYSCYMNYQGFNLDLRIFLRKDANNFKPQAYWTFTSYSEGGSRGQAYSSWSVSNGIISQIKFLGRYYTDSYNRYIKSGTNYLIQGIKR